jgi:predicted phosphate transport protein (TIGR00153 family)
MRGREESGDFMGLKDIFKPKPNKFIQLLLEQTKLTVKGLELLNLYLEQPDPNVARKLSDTEKKADEVRRILIEELMHTFVTPFDREDIFSLSREIDDILDYANTTVDEMEILDVATTEFMQRMARLLYDAAQEIQLAVQRFQDNHLNVANDHVQRAKALENRVETVYREALADLFKGPVDIDHIMEMLKEREIYRHLSNAADREDTAANVIADVIMKVS